MNLIFTYKKAFLTASLFAITISPLHAEELTGDVELGIKVSKKCKACHKFKEDAGKSIGPNLWNIVDRPIAAIENFKYSKSFKKRVGTFDWTDENLDKFLTKPRKFIKGTKMAFAGLKSEEDRAGIIAWLKTLK